MKMLSEQALSTVSGGCLPFFGSFLRPAYRHTWGGWASNGRNTNTNVNINHIHLPQGGIITSKDTGGNDDGCECN